jgi:hypothetical protein
LRRRMTLFRRPPIPAGGIGEIGENPMSARIEQSQPIGGFRISDGSRRRPFLQGRGVIATFVSVAAALRCRSGPAPLRIEPRDPLLPGFPPP